MGIPVFFKTLVSRYQDNILIKHNDIIIDTLYLDLNCLIHPCCRGLTDESIMIQTIITSIESLISYTNLTTHLMIAIDGVAPMGKMKQQRMRRHKSIYDSKPWDTNAISPGTHFMTALNHALHSWILTQSNKPYSIHLSDSTEPGEGEHKILQSIKHDPALQTQHVAIYGLDADLIMLGLLTDLPQIYLLRERTEYNIENCDNEFIYLDIPQLRSFILHDLQCESQLGPSIIIHDYIFICFLLGNDFINHSPTLNLRYHGYNVLISIYKSLQSRYQGHFQLIDLSLDHLIHLTFFREFIHEISSQESRLLKSIHTSRIKQSKRLLSKYHSEFHDWTSFISDPSSISLHDIHSFPTHPDPLIQESRSSFLEHLPMFYISQEPSFSHQHSSKDLCTDYLHSLIWCAHYYFKQCIHWTWTTTYDTAPRFTDLESYLKQLPHLSFDSQPTPNTIPEQLSYILPHESHHLHSFPISSSPKDPSNIHVHLSHCRYLWEAPLIDIN